MTLGRPTALPYAKVYAALGWPVLPITPGAKTPVGSCVPRGYLDATCDVETIERWWTDVPDAGVGVAVGMAGIVAIDVDPRNGGDASVLPFDIAGTLHAQTGGGGLHILFRVPAGYEPIASPWAGIDLKWNGYIVVEPTVHPSGRAYGFVDWDVLSGEIPEIRSAPLQLVQRVGTVAEVASFGTERLTAEERADLEATLATIPADARGAWIEVGYALASIAEDGFAIWDTWSQRSSKYDSADARRVWASFARTRSHWKWVLKNARALGGRNVSTRARPSLALVVSTSDPPPIPHQEGDPGPTHEGDEAGEARPSRRRRKPIDMGRFNDLLKHFVLIYGTDTVYDLRERMIIKVNALRLAYGSDVVKLWLGNDSRRMILPEELVFDPGGTCSENCINLYGGLALEPVEGDVGPFLELLEHLCSESALTDEKVAQVVGRVLDWLAYPLKHPGAKLMSAMVFHGPQGAGKNLLFEILVAIYGRYGIVVGQDQLEDKFNDWASQKLFVIGDEVVARLELYHQKNKLKAFITGSTIQINTKMLPLRTEANHVNVVFLSNEQQPLALEPDDRRYMVVYTPPRREEELYKRVGAFLEAGGVARVLWYLLHRDVGDFGPHTPPLMTRAKADLIELGLKPPERFAREWLRGFLALPLQPCSSEQLYRAFRHWSLTAGERYPPPQVSFSKALEKVTKGKLRSTVIKLDLPDRGKLATRMWIPEGCGPPEGMTAGHWATDAVAEFERVLRVFCRAPGDDE